jgi:plasmid stabilization system protein ParE
VNITWTTEARKALRAIEQFIARDSEFYASRMISQIVEQVEYVAAHPTKGHFVHEYPELSLREVHATPYRIIYAVSDEGLKVVTIIHFRQILLKKRLTRR